MGTRVSTICASLVGLVFLPGPARADFIPWSYTTKPQGTVLVYTDLTPLPPGNNGNVTGEAQVILSGATGPKQLINGNIYLHEPLISNVVFQIDYLGNGGFKPTTATILVDMTITDLASGKSGTIYIPFDAGSILGGVPFANVQLSPENLAGYSMTLGHNQYFIAPDIFQSDAFVEITPVSTPSPEPSGLVLGILGALPLGVVIGVRHFRSFS
ncbi:MAG TPA: hypothetical protein VGX70_12500 [Gemmataceae bacterium]|nr:hypothetical protein [Gemmataceae bacterium]